VPLAVVLQPWAWLQARPLLLPPSVAVQALTRQLEELPSAAAVAAQAWAQQGSPRWLRAAALALLAWQPALLLQALLAWQPALLLLALLAWQPALLRLLPLPAAAAAAAAAALGPQAWHC
jgi:hypothetical protein